MKCNNIMLKHYIFAALDGKTGRQSGYQTGTTDKQKAEAIARTLEMAHNKAAPRDAKINVIVFTAVCQHCGKHSIWNGGTMVYPDHADAPPPNPDMPDTIKQIYHGVPHLTDALNFQTPPFRLRCLLL